MLLLKRKQSENKKLKSLRNNELEDEEIIKERKVLIED